MRQRLGCLSGTGLVAALVTVLAIAGYTYARGGLLYNPGPLNAQSGSSLGGVTSHAEIGGECQACHTAPWESATMADRCIVCHAEIAAQLTDIASLHGALMQDNPSLTCRHCHSEHRGANAPLTVLDSDDFPHDATGFSLLGAHAEVSCEACHLNRQFTGTPMNCHACHQQDDEHAGQFGTDCAACHNPSAWSDASFDHNLSAFPLTGSHARLTCEQCHSAGQFEGLPTACANCHGEPDFHAGLFGTDCAACHNTTSWTPAEFNGQHTFPLDHGGGATCATCHPSSFTTYTCYGCHEHEEADVRSEHLDEGISNFQNCMECHLNGQEPDDDNEGSG
jgi:hypothetical protein